MNNDIVPGFDDEKNDSIKLTLQKIENMDRGLIVYASGYIDTYNVGFYRKPVERAIESGYVRIVFELSRVNYISSTGFGAFPHFLKLVKPQNGDMVLNQVQPKVYEVFALLGFSQYFAFMENLDESIGYLAEHLESPLFPKVFTCPICSKRLRASKAGRFRCAECKTILVIDKATSVMIG